MTGDQVGFVSPQKNYQGAISDSDVKGWFRFISPYVLW